MIRYVLVIFMGFLASACTPVERYSVTLNPSFFQLHESSHQRNTGPSDLLLDRQGSGLSPELIQWRTSDRADDTVLVGFSNDILRRPDPFPNDRWTWRVWQAKAFFDMSLLPDGAILQEANLVFDAPLVGTDIRTYPQREGATNGCGLRIGSAIEPLSTGASSTSGPGSALPYRPTRPHFDVRGTGGGVDISGTALAWTIGTRSNTGLLFSVVNEAIETEDETQYCARYVSRPRLEVIYALPVSP